MALDFEQNREYSSESYKLAWAVGDTQMRTAQMKTISNKDSVQLADLFHIPLYDTSAILHCVCYNTVWEFFNIFSCVGLW